MIFTIRHMSRITGKPILWSMDADQPKHATKANPGRLFSPLVDFLFRESLLYTSFPMRRNVSARISLRGNAHLIWVDTLRKVHNVGFLVERLISLSCVLRKSYQRAVRYDLARKCSKIVARNSDTLQTFVTQIR